MFLQRLRLVLAIAGLIFAVAGVTSNNRIVIWTAIALLGLAFLVRLFLKKRQDRQD